MAYIISNGKDKYIRYDKSSGKYVSIKNRKLAMVWKDKYKAESILKNAVSKKEKSQYRVVEIEEAGKPEEQIVTVAEANRRGKEAQVEFLKAMSKEEIPASQMNIYRDYIQAVKEFTEMAEGRKTDLVNTVSQTDKRIVDIQHYIEFNDLNVYEGFLAYKSLQSQLRQRRIAKNESFVLSQIIGCELNLARIGEVQNIIDGMDCKQYSPRALPQLFS